MSRNARYAVVAGVVLAALVGAWVVFSTPTPPPRTSMAASAETGGSGVLDGMTFSGVMRLTSDNPVDDTFVFANGTFMSEECDRRCGYPARAYFVRHVGEKIEFYSESSCLHKDASFEWRGTVENGTISGVANWTVNRWYWTIEEEIAFHGTLTKAAGSVASNQ